ncbi:hypothetical protein D6C93_08600 [Aureobasidium pullulans]|nr:hypothetical protein D6C93_08600 [Aureobasidium pullulans]
MADSRDNARRSTADVFDDEFAVDDFDGVADGFAPGRVQTGDSRWSIHSEDPSIRSVHAHMSDAPHFSTGPSRNSMHKPRDTQNPFSSAEDEDDDSHDERSALQRSHSIQSTSTAQYAPGIAHRLSTASSARTFARTASPLHGTSGPSHPYSMYPQDTNLARTPSISTTTSTIRAAQTSNVSHQGPTHPYSMYPQNVSAHDEEADTSVAPPSHAQTVIPVGFPGRNQAFVRTRGPEDEEQDIIGVDGHSEQLPPYSEYPEDGVPKPIVAPAQAATPPSTTQIHLPLMQQQRQPQSMSDQADAHGFAEMQQLNSIDSNDTPSEAKSWSEKSWKEKRKTRFCGIPFWWILLSLCVLAFIAIVLGAAIGGIFASARKEAEKANNHRGPTTTLLDASPIPTSSIGAPPPTGVYALDFGPPRATQSACITNQNYSAAWACNIYGTPQMAINIGSPPDGSDSEGACLYGFNNATGINYGTQPPNTHFAPFISVEDDDEPYRGPAFYFQTYYDKFVVVPESSLPASNAASQQKRSYVNSNWFTQHQVQAGDKPWFCWFNQTFLEGFVYANNYTLPSDSASSSSMASSSYSKSPKTSSAPLTTSTIIEVSGPSTTATLTSASQSTAYAHPVSNLYTHTSNGRRAKRSWQLEKRGWTFAELSSFGYVVKIEERRAPNSPEPYCQQFQILDNGMAGALQDPSTGQQITITLEETDPDLSAYTPETTDGSPSGSSKVKRDPINGACHCEWWSGSSSSYGSSSDY